LALIVLACFPLLVARRPYRQADLADVYKSGPIHLRQDTGFGKNTELIEGPFNLTIDSRIMNMCFTEKGLIAMVEVKDAPEFELRVIRVRLTNP